VTTGQHCNPPPKGKKGEKIKKDIKMDGSKKSSKRGWKGEKGE